jgi:hypothetical protein
MRNGKDIPLTNQASGLTNVSEVLDFDFQPALVTVITTIMVRGYPSEDPTNYDTLASIQPMPQELVIKKEGERAWKWWVVRLLPDISVKEDDKLVIDGTAYRVKSKMDWAQYGYQELECIEDYTNAE